MRRSGKLSHADVLATIIGFFYLRQTNHDFQNLFFNLCPKLHDRINSQKERHSYWPELKYFCLETLCQD